MLSKNEKWDLLGILLATPGNDCQNLLLQLLDNLDLIIDINRYNKNPQEYDELSEMTPLMIAVRSR